MALTVSVLQGGANSHQTTSEEVNFDRTDLMSPGVVGVMTNTSGVAPATGGFAVNAQGSPDMTVAVSAGVCNVTATPTSGNSQLLRVKNSASTNVTISANSTGGTRFDWVYVKIDPDKAKDPNAGATDVSTLVTSRSTSSTTDNGTPPTYGTLIAVVTVANGASSIVNGNITDWRVRSVAVGGINDTNGNEELKVVATASAVNELTITNAATGNAPQLGSSGSDTNIDLRLVPKGTGNVKRGSSGGSIDWWEEIGRTTLSGAADTISVSSFSGRKYLWIKASLIATGGTVSGTCTFNSDTGANYAIRASNNGAADGTASSQNNFSVVPSTAAQNCEVELFVNDNNSAREKSIQILGYTTGTSGAGNVPERREGVGKWANTAAQITTVTITNGGTGDYASGSEVVVLGHD